MKQREEEKKGREKSERERREGKRGERREGGRDWRWEVSGFNKQKKA